MQVPEPVSEPKGAGAKSFCRACVVHGSEALATKCAKKVYLSRVLISPAVERVVANSLRTGLSCELCYAFFLAVWMRMR